MPRRESLHLHGKDPCGLPWDDHDGRLCPDQPRADKDPLRVRPHGPAEVDREDRIWDDETEGLMDDSIILWDDPDEACRG